MIWSRHIDCCLVQPTVANGVIYTGIRSGKTVYALNARTGAELWQRNIFSRNVLSTSLVVLGPAGSTNAAAPNVQ